MNNDNFFFFFRFFPFFSLFSETPRGGGFTGGRGVWDVYSRVAGGYQSVGVVSKLPKAGRGFQCRLPMPWWGIGKTGRGDDREGCRLVTAADRSWLGIAGRGASTTGGATTATGGEGRGWTLEVAGLGLQNGVILMLLTSKRRHFDVV